MVNLKCLSCKNSTWTHPPAEESPCVAPTGVIPPPLHFWLPWWPMTLRPEGERWVCHCIHPTSPWKPMTLRATISSVLPPPSPFANNSMFCLNGVLKIVCSGRDIGLFRTSLLAWTKILCDSKLFGKAVCIGKPAVKAMVARGTIELLTQRHMMWLKTLFFFSCHMEKKADESEGMVDGPFCMERKLKGQNSLLA